MCGVPVHRFVRQAASLPDSFAACLYDPTMVSWVLKLLETAECWLCSQKNEILRRKSPARLQLRVLTWRNETGDRDT